MASINANMNASVGWIPLTEAAALALVPGFYTLDSENLEVGGVHLNNGYSWGRPNGRWVTRGFAGSTATSHTSGATLVRYYPEAPGGGGNQTLAQVLAQGNDMDSQAIVSKVGGFDRAKIDPGDGSSLQITNLDATGSDALAGILLIGGGPSELWAQNPDNLGEFLGQLLLGENGELAYQLLSGRSTIGNLPHASYAVSDGGFGLQHDFFLRDSTSGATLIQVTIAPQANGGFQVFIGNSSFNFRGDGMEVYATPLINNPGLGTIAVTANGAGGDEQQSLTPEVAPTGGTWDLSLPLGPPLTNIAWDITAVALAVLISDADIVVGGGPLASGPFTFTFTGGHGNLPWALLTADGSNLVDPMALIPAEVLHGGPGGTATGVITATADGGSASIGPVATATTAEIQVNGLPLYTAAAGAAPGTFASLFYVDTTATTGGTYLWNFLTGAYVKIALALTP